MSVVCWSDAHRSRQCQVMPVRWSRGESDLSGDVAARWLVQVLRVQFGFPQSVAVDVLERVGRRRYVVLIGSDPFECTVRHRTARVDVIPCRRTLDASRHRFERLTA